VTKTYEQDYHGMLSLPAFLVTDHERLYTTCFWAKATGNPKPRPHITFQDEDSDYAYIDGEYVQLSAFWHKYCINLVVPYKLRGHNVVCNIMVGSYLGKYYFDEFQVTNALFVSPPPSPPSPPPSPPPNVLLQFNFESYDKGTVNSQAWPEGEMEVVVQSQSAAHSGRFGLFIKVSRRFDHDWHAQVSFKPFLPPDTSHGYIVSFWARSATDGADQGATPKVVFHDADDNYTPLKMVSVPLTPDWNMYQVDLSIPSYRKEHSVVIAFWVGEFVGSYSIDDLEVQIVNPFKPPPPPPPSLHKVAMAPPPPGVVALLGFEGTDDGVIHQQTANNGTWVVSIPDARAAHTGAQGLYVEVSKAFRVANLAQLLLPRYVPRAGKETLLHLSFYAKVEKMRSIDPKPTVTVAFLDLHKNYEVLGSEVVSLTGDWQMHYVVIDLKTVHLGHSIRPYLYMGMHAGIYSFDDFEYKEIEIEDGMRWLQRAPERIKQYRMGKFDVTFLDREDWPIDYGTATVKLVRHGFPLGVTLKTKPMSGLNAEDYQWYLNTAAKHFWSGTLQEPLQWYEYEPEPGNVRDTEHAVEEVLAWAEAQRWAQMGAALFDGGHGGKDHWSNKLACKELQTRLHERVLRDLRHFGGRIGRYEVWKGALVWREWLERCGQDLFFNAFRWAQQADDTATLCSSEFDVLSTLTLTNAEAYHNMIWGMNADGVPVKGIGVQARFNGEVDASTVKHRLDVLHELQIPVYVTELSISSLDPAKHTYELEKFLRIAFSHPAVGGITFGDMWDHGNAHPGSGLYAENKQMKPAAEKIDSLFRQEWHTDVTQQLTSEGSVRMEAFYGLYAYELRSGDRVCTGEVELVQDAGHADDRYQTYRNEPRTFVVKCDWEGHMHFPVWATPLLIALTSVGCLLACYRKRTELLHKSNGVKPLRQTEPE